ncbi:hypothetical protein Q6291_33125, partial [Klebsiella pneumoniae]
KAFAGILNEDDITAALQACQAADSIKYKDIYAKDGLSAKSPDDIKKAFAVIDQDKSGFIEPIEQTERGRKVAEQELVDISA